MPNQQESLPGIQPTSQEEAVVFADHYLTPDLQKEFVERHLQGVDFWDWLSAANKNLSHEVWIDGLCVTSEIGALPYTERLNAVAKERKHFEVWRATQGGIGGKDVR